MPQPAQPRPPRRRWGEVIDAWVRENAEQLLGQGMKEATLTISVAFKGLGRNIRWKLRQLPLRDLVPEDDGPA
jgi:hypothetical protein